jgi:hypothetical protein
MRWNGKSCGWCWETSDTQGMPLDPFPLRERVHRWRGNPAWQYTIERVLGLLLLIAFSL